MEPEKVSNEAEREVEEEAEGEGEAEAEHKKGKGKACGAQRRWRDNHITAPTHCLCALKQEEAERF